MESQPQLTQSHGQHYEQDPLHRPVEGEEEHHEKTSVFKRVKAKARKIKDSITTKSHGDHDDHEDDEEDEEDEEDIVQDPEIHGAPKYEPAAAKNYATAPDVNIARPHADPVPALEENVCPGTFQTKVTDSSFPSAPKHDSGAPGNFTTGTEPKLGALKGTLGDRLREDTNVPKPRHEDDLPGPGHVSSAIKNFDTPHDLNTKHIKDTLGGPILEEPKSPKRRHDDFSEPTTYKANAGVGHQEAGVSPISQSFDKMGISDEPQYKKGSPTTGGHGQFGHPAAGTVGATSILHSFDKMGIHDDPQHKKESTAIGSRDQFSPSPSPSPSQTPIPEFSSHKSDPISENTPSVPRSFNATTDEHHPQDVNLDQPTTQQTGYTGKISAVGPTIADKAIAAKNAVAPKVGFGGNNENAASTGFPRPEETEQNVTGEPQKGQSSYFSSATSAITGTAISAKNAVASKLGYGGSETAHPTSVTEGSEIARSAGSETAKSGGGVTGYVTEKLAPVYGTVAGAGTAVLSKIPGTGMGTQKDTPGHDQTGTGTGALMETDRGVVGESDKGTVGSEAAKSGGVTGYVTQKLAPVYGTVAGAGTAVLSKIPGTGMGTQKDTTEHETTGTGTGVGAPMATGRGVTGESDKGVAGMKGYIAEKLRPGEEDKALSEVISDALHKKTPVKSVDEEEKSNMGGIVKDAFHQRNNVEDMDTDNTNTKPMGKVTESDEVATRLGSSESEKAGHLPGMGNESPSSTGVVDKFKGAFTNWFGKGGETNPSQAFNDQIPSHGTTGEAQKEGENVSYEGERRIHESTN